MTRIKTFRFGMTKRELVDYDRCERTGWTGRDEKNIDDTINEFLEGKELVDIKVFVPAFQQLVYFTVIYKE